MELVTNVGIFVSYQRWYFLYIYKLGPGAMSGERVVPPRHRSGSQARAGTCPRVRRGPGQSLEAEPNER